MEDTTEYNEEYSFDNMMFAFDPEENNTPSGERQNNDQPNPTEGTSSDGNSLFSQPNESSSEGEGYTSSLPRQVTTPKKQTNRDNSKSTEENKAIQGSEKTEKQQQSTGSGINLSSFSISPPAESRWHSGSNPEKKKTQRSITENIYALYPDLLKGEKKPKRPISKSLPSQPKKELIFN